MPAGVKIPMREPIGRASPRVIHQFSDKVGEFFKKENERAKAAHTSSGLISGSKLGQPTLWSVLNILGIEKDFDSYLLGKFQRGHDVETRAIVLLTNLPYELVYGIVSSTSPNPGWIDVPAGAVLTGQVHLQYEVGYRGGIGFIDMAQRLTEESQLIHHEIKSSTKMAYDKVAATGRSRAGKPEPYYHQALQAAFYGLGETPSHSFIHYFNADDYRLISFAINPMDYKEEIDKEIDDIQAAFLTKTMPSFEAFLPYHKAYMKTSYGEWNYLSPSQSLEQLRISYPEAYKTFMSKELPV